MYVMGEARGFLKSARTRLKEMTHRIGLRHTWVSPDTRRIPCRSCAQTTLRRPCARGGRLGDTSSPQYRHRGSSEWRDKCRGRYCKLAEVSNAMRLPKMGFAQISFEEDGSKWGCNAEIMKTYRVAEDPLDGSFLNEVFYRCHLELQRPDHQDQVIRIR